MQTSGQWPEWADQILARSRICPFLQQQTMGMVLTGCGWVWDRGAAGRAVRGLLIKYYLSVSDIIIPPPACCLLSPALAAAGAAAKQIHNNEPRRSGRVGLQPPESISFSPPSSKYLMMGTTSVGTRVFRQASSCGLCTSAVTFLSGLSCACNHLPARTCVDHTSGDLITLRNDQTFL